MSYNKNDASQGAPPAYPQQAFTQQHYDAGPVPGASPNPYGQGPSNPPPANAEYYGSAPPQGYYPPQQGYGPPQQGMYYQQQPYGPPQGYQDGRRGRRGGGEGFCAALIGALACCCCLDFIF